MSTSVVDLEEVRPSGGVSVEEGEAEAVRRWSISSTVLDLELAGASVWLLDDAGAGGGFWFWSRSTTILDIEEFWSTTIPYLHSVKASEK